MSEGEQAACGPAQSRTLCFSLCARQALCFRRGAGLGTAAPTWDGGRRGALDLGSR